MNVILHIGWHKTGSTSLQVFLWRNREKLAGTLGTYYPDEGLLTCAHHTVAWTFRKMSSSPWGPVPLIEGGGSTYVQRAVESARSRGCTRIIFSSEAFCNADLDTLRRLSDALGPVATSVQVVAYIRRQDLFMESIYNMDVKWWGTRVRADFDEYLARKPTGPDYAEVLGRWASVFGRGSIVVRPYSRDALEGRDIRSDFCRAVGLDSPDLDMAEPESNRSLGPRTLETMRVLNNLDVTEDAHKAIEARFVAYDQRNGSPRSVLFEPDARRAYMTALEQSNDGLVAFGVDPAQFVVGDDETGRRNVRKQTPAELAEMFAYLGRPT